MDRNKKTEPNIELSKKIAKLSKLQTDLLTAKRNIKIICVVSHFLISFSMFVYFLIYVYTENKFGIIATGVTATCCFYLTYLAAFTEDKYDAIADKIETILNRFLLKMRKFESKKDC